MSTSIPDLVAAACRIVQGQSELARQIGVSPAQVWQWCRGTRPVPTEYCWPIEKATDAKVTRAELRPDDYWLIWPDLPAPAHAQPATQEG